MSDFKLAMPTIFAQEGRYVNNVNDPGGATDYGISLHFLLRTGDLDHDGFKDGDLNHDGLINVEDIKHMTPEEAENLYDLYFWTPNQYELIRDQAIATKVFSLSVNMGSIGAHKCVQRAVRAASGVVLVEDGCLGNMSFESINAINPLMLLPALKSEAAGYYRNIRFKDPTKNPDVFLKGWLNRAYSDMVLSA